MLCLATIKNNQKLQLHKVGFTYLRQHMFS